MQSGPLHELVKPMSWIMGTWKSIRAVVDYPTMKAPVDYCEDMQFASVGLPWLNYRSLTWNAKDRTPMHFESGYIRLGEDKSSVYFLMSTNFGVVTLEEGKATKDSIKLSSSSITHTQFALKEVPCILRCYSLTEDGQLEYTLKMQTVDTPMTEHACAVYKKC